MAARSTARPAIVATAAERKRRRSRSDMRGSTQRQADSPRAGGVAIGRWSQRATRVELSAVGYAHARPHAVAVRHPASQRADLIVRVEAMMPASYRIDVDRRLVLTRAWGVFTAQDLF